ncbi:MAG: azurin [Bacteroidetes bacterium 47-18]|nr:MAG: azurin [Bacteroidetes bacterium 47-18]
MKKSILLLASAVFVFASCGDPSAPEQAATPGIGTPAPETPQPVNNNEAIVTISGGDDMKFDLATIKVKEGQTVKLTLKHTGKAPLSAMGHNVVILAHGVDMATFAGEAMNAKDNDYIPKSMEKDVIAHTKTIGGGETTTIEFTAPAKGTYDFLCSFPGHAAMMKGKFIVE